MSTAFRLLIPPSTHPLDEGLQIFARHSQSTPEVHVTLPHIHPCPIIPTSSPTFLAFDAPTLPHVFLLLGTVRARARHRHLGGGARMLAHRQGLPQPRHCRHGDQEGQVAGDGGRLLGAGGGERDSGIALPRRPHRGRGGLQGSAEARVREPAQPDLCARQRGAQELGGRVPCGGRGRGVGIQVERAGGR